MQEGGAARNDLDRGADAEGGKQRHRIRLGVESVGEPAPAPVAAFAARLGAAAPHGRCGDPLVGVARAEEDLADFKQRYVVKPAARVAFGRSDQAGRKTGAHV